MGTSDLPFPTQSPPYGRSGGGGPSIAQPAASICSKNCRLIRQAADRVYQTCTDYLIEATRDRKKFPLVFAELTIYGFPRDLWGIKPAGMALAALGLVMSIAALSYGCLSAGTVFPVAGVTMAINAAPMVWSAFRIKPQWIRVVAGEYAKRLLAAC
jgi:hypothetical protein